MSPRAFVILFCVVLATPALWQVAGDVAAGRQTLIVEFWSGFRPDNTWFARFERQCEEDWPPTSAIRGAVQSALLHVFREGNDKVLVPKDHWLVYRPGLEAVLGRGPLGGDVRSVARPPPAIPWQIPLEAILDFHTQLAARGIGLMFAPVPDKVSIHPEILGVAKTEGAVRHPGMVEFEKRLMRAGVRVLPVADILHAAARGSGEDVFLRQDTHWNRAGLFAVVDAAARELEDLLPRGEVRTNGLEEPVHEVGKMRASRGDLAAMLAKPVGDGFPVETAGTWAIRPLSSGSDELVPLLVLGDSFVNIYREPELGFGAEGGFAELVAARLGCRADVIAINGGGATQVRNEAARRPQLWIGKRAVIWLIAERELCPGPPEDRIESAVWRKTALPPVSSKTDGQGAPSLSDGINREERGATLVVEGVLEDVPAWISPGQAPYRDCLGVMLYRVERVVNGEFTESTIPVVHWIFEEENLLPPSEFEPGARHRLALEPFERQPARIQNLQRVDDTMDLRPLWWVAAWQSAE